MPSASGLQEIRRHCRAHGAEPDDANRFLLRPPDKGVGSRRRAGGFCRRRKPPAATLIRGAWHFFFAFFPEVFFFREDFFFEKTRGFAFTGTNATFHGGSTCLLYLGLFQPCSG